jgi:hypothetical protein
MSTIVHNNLDQIKSCQSKPRARRITSDANYCSGGLPMLRSTERLEAINMAHLVLVFCFGTRI